HVLQAVQEFPGGALVEHADERGAHQDAREDREHRVVGQRRGVVQSVLGEEPLRRGFEGSTAHTYHGARCAGAGASKRAIPSSASSPVQSVCVVTAQTRKRSRTITEAANSGYLGARKHWFTAETTATSTASVRFPRRLPRRRLTPSSASAATTPTSPTAMLAQPQAVVSARYQWTPPENPKASPPAATYPRRSCEALIRSSRDPATIGPPRRRRRVGGFQSWRVNAVLACGVMPAANGRGRLSLGDG